MATTLEKVSTVQQNQTIAPRAMREADAAAYLAFSGSYLRNERVADMRRQREGQPIRGPRWVNVNSAVRYLREDLDAWIESKRSQAAT